MGLPDKAIALMRYMHERSQLSYASLGLGFKFRVYEDPKP